mmetsp:Transcript_43712/g.103209  ORF Transcript_43712/g.103209 Transcript_43712/m.103209 type:complete len:356 (+) Transcript_43712:125-1192(+)
MGNKKNSRSRSPVVVTPGKSKKHKDRKQKRSEDDVSPPRADDRHRGAHDAASGSRGAEPSQEMSTADALQVLLRGQKDIQSTMGAISGRLAKIEEEVGKIPEMESSIRQIQIEYRSHVAPRLDKIDEMESRMAAFAERLQSIEGKQAQMEQDQDGHEKWPSLLEAARKMASTTPKRNEVPSASELDRVRRSVAVNGFPKNTPRARIIEQIEKGFGVGSKTIYINDLCADRAVIVFDQEDEARDFLQKNKPKKEVDGQTLWVGPDQTTAQKRALWVCRLAMRWIENKTQTTKNTSGIKLYKPSRRLWRTESLPHGAAESEVPVCYVRNGKLYKENGFKAEWDFDGLIEDIRRRECL